MNTSTSAIGSNFVELGTVYVPQPVVDLIVRLFTSWAQNSIAPVPGSVAGDENKVDIAEPLTSSASHERSPFHSPPTEPARSAAPTTTSEDGGVEESDADGGTAAPAPGTGASPATHPAGDARPPFLAPHARAGRAWSRRRGGRPRPSPAGPLSARSVDMADEDPALVPECCARCGTPGVRTEVWVCGVCDEPFIISGEFVLSLHGLDEELAAGGLYCESCGERRSLFERLACTGCSAPARRIEDVLAHNRREQGRRVADAVVDAQVELLDDGITTDPEIEALLPRESSEEYALLEQDLRAHGCVAPLVVWQDGPRQVLLDGHTRRAICRARRIFYEKKILEFPDRTSAILWVIENQLGRRNLTPEAQAYLRGRIYNLEKRQGARTDLDTSRQGGEKLSERLAVVYKVGSRTIERDGRFAANLDHLAAVYGAAIKNAVLARDAKMTRAEVAKAVRLDALTQARVVARAQQGEAAIDVICEALRDRGLNDRLTRRAHAAEGEEDAGDAEASTSSGEPRDRADARPGPSGARGAGGLLSQGEELVTPSAVPQGPMMPIDPAGARGLPAPRAEDLASTVEVEVDEHELASIPRALADVRSKLRRSKPGRMNADLVSTLREFLTQIDRELRLHEEAATESG